MSVLSILEFLMCHIFHHEHDVHHGRLHEMRFLVFALVALGFSLISLSIAGAVVGGGHLDLVRPVGCRRGSFVGVSVQFQGLYKPFGELSCGVLFWALQSSGAVHLGG